MSAKFEQLLSLYAQNLATNIERHQVTSNISLAAHIMERRIQKARLVADRQLVYLDTNAWKCLIDVRLNKPRITPEMIEFAKALELCQKSQKHFFPIGLATFFELDSMTNDDSHNALIEFVDELSLGYSISAFPERISMEMRQLRKGNFTADNKREDFLRNPIELFGIPTLSFNHEVDGLVKDANTFNKAFFDTVSELPTSAQFAISRDVIGPKWSNSKNTASHNLGKMQYQSDVKNINTGIFLELQGIIEVHLEKEGDPAIKFSNVFALTALDHWRKDPASRAYPTLRVLSGLHGLMRYDTRRKYKDGDDTDFLAASSALPIASAFFTDRRLASLIHDSKDFFGPSFDCAVIGGFAEMAKFLTARE